MESEKIDGITKFDSTSMFLFFWSEWVMNTPIKDRESRFFYPDLSPFPLSCCNVLYGLLFLVISRSPKSRSHFHFQTFSKLFHFHIHVITRHRFWFLSGYFVMVYSSRKSLIDKQVKRNIFTAKSLYMGKYISKIKITSHLYFNSLLYREEKNLLYFCRTCYTFRWLTR